MAEGHVHFQPPFIYVYHTVVKKKNNKTKNYTHGTTLYNYIFCIYKISTPTRTHNNNNNNTGNKKALGSKCLRRACANAQCRRFSGRDSGAEPYFPAHGANAGAELHAGPSRRKDHVRIQPVDAGVLSSDKNVFAIIYINLYIYL